MLISTLINILQYSIHLCISQNISYVEGKNESVSQAGVAQHHVQQVCPLLVNTQGGDSVWQ